MNAQNNTEFRPSNSKDTFRNNSKFPIHFDKLHEGSLFRIVAEPSRGLFRVKDNTLYKKAVNGFFATPFDDDTKGVCLMPNDLVMPVVPIRQQASNVVSFRKRA